MYRVLSTLLLLLFFPVAAHANAMFCVQSRLNALGHDAGAPDGIFGKRTRKAAEAYAITASVDIPALDKDNAEYWCGILARDTIGTPGFERDHPRKVSLFQFDSIHYCSGSFLKSVDTRRTISRSRERLVPLLEWFNIAISNYRRFEYLRADIVRDFVRFADEDAFSRLDWSGKGSSPAHWQSNLLKNIAILTNVIDQNNGWSLGQRNRVARWGDRVYLSTHYSAWGRRQSDRWTDTVAAASASYLLWGTVAPNEAAYLEGKDDFLKMSSRFKKSGGTRTFFRNKKLLGGWLPKNWGARLEDKTIGDFVIAAHVGRAVGDDLFFETAGDTNLYDMVLGWQKTLFEDELPKGEDLSFFSLRGQERSWSWTEYFSYNFPDDPNFTALREKSRELVAGWGHGYQGLATGPASCLLRTSIDDL